MQARGCLEGHGHARARDDEARQIRRRRERFEGDPACPSLRFAAHAPDRLDEGCRILLDRNLVEDVEVRGELCRAGFDVLQVRRAQLDCIHDRAPDVGRRHLTPIVGAARTGNHGKAPGRFGAVDQRTGRFAELTQPRDGHDEASQRPRLRAIPIGRVVADGLAHRKRGWREQPGVVNRAGEQRSDRRRFRGAIGQVAHRQRCLARRRRSALARFFFFGFLGTRIVPRQPGVPQRQA